MPRSNTLYQSATCGWWWSGKHTKSELRTDYKHIFIYIYIHTYIRDTHLLVTQRHLDGKNVLCVCVCVSVRMIEWNVCGQDLGGRISLNSHLVTPSNTHTHTYFIDITHTQKNIYNDRLNTWLTFRWARHKIRPL